MPDELELLTINAALDSWVDLVPDAISTGYQAQNTNIEGRTNGLESLYIEISGTDAVFNPSGVIDDNGAPMVVKTQVTLAVPSGQRFVRVIDGVDPTKRSLQLESSLGVYDESKNGYYTSGDRMLNWSLNDISGSLKSYKILAPLHAHILGDALFDGNITQTSGVTTLLSGAQIQGASGLSGDAPLDLYIRNTRNTSGFIVGQTWGRYAFYSDDASGIGAGVKASIDVYTSNITSGARNGLSLKFSTETLLEEGLRLDELGYVFGARDLTTGGRILANGAIDNTIDALQVAGSIYASTHIRAVDFLQAGSTGLSAGQVVVAPSSMELGQGRTVDGAVFIDLTGDTFYTDFGLRIIRNSGANGATSFAHRGTGLFNIQCSENATIGLHTYATFSNTAIELKKNTTITGFVNVSNYVKSNFLTGGTSETDGANIILKAADDVGAPSTIVFRKGTTEYGRFNGADSSLTLNGALTLANELNPTTTPTESTTATVSASTTQMIPRGTYNIYGNIISTSGGADVSIILERLRGGVWYNVDTFDPIDTGIGLLGSTNSSSGSDLRVRYTTTGTFSANTILQKT